MPPYWPKPAAAMIAIDTNIVVRFLTGDNAEQSARAQRRQSAVDHQVADLPAHQHQLRPVRQRDVGPTPKRPRFVQLASRRPRFLRGARTAAHQ